MLDSIYIGMSGLMGYSQGLRVIADNTANINTPGFKGSTLQFGNMVQSGGSTGGPDAGQAGPLGQGLTTYTTTFDFSQGELRSTGNDLDLAIDGQGLFTLRDDAGRLVYARAGEFVFGEDGVLVSRSSGARVLARDEAGALTEVSLAGLRTNEARATATLKFRGNLSNDSSRDENVHTLSEVAVYDGAGGLHSLSVRFEQLATTVSGQVRWKVSVQDGTTAVGSGELLFVDGKLDPDAAKVSITYKPSGVADVPLSFDFGVDVTSYPAGTLSDLRVISQDGYQSGALTGASFDPDGVLNMSYSNGQDVKGVRLALARFTSTDNVRALGNNLFESLDAAAWETGVAKTGAFGEIRSGVVEISNVDLSAEFSDLVIMQRGYQAASQVISTANEMIQELYSLNRR